MPNSNHHGNREILQRDAYPADRPARRNRRAPVRAVVTAS